MHIAKNGISRYASEDTTLTEIRWREMKCWFLLHICQSNLSGFQATLLSALAKINSLATSSSRSLVVILSVKKERRKKEFKHIKISASSFCHFNHSYAKLVIVSNCLHSSWYNIGSLSRSILSQYCSSH